MSELDDVKRLLPTVTGFVTATLAGGATSGVRLDNLAALFSDIEHDDFEALAAISVVLTANVVQAYARQMDTTPELLWQRMSAALLAAAEAS